MQSIEQPDLTMGPLIRYTQQVTKLCCKYKLEKDAFYLYELPNQEIIVKY